MKNIINGLNKLIRGNKIMIKTKWIEIDWWSDEQTLQIREKMTKYETILEVSDFLTEFQCFSIALKTKSFPNFSFDFFFLKLTGLDLEDDDQYAVCLRMKRSVFDSKAKYREHYQWIRQAYER